MRRLLFLVVLLPLVLSGIALAAGLYYSDVTVIDTSGSARTGVPALVPMGIDEMVDQGFLDSTGLYSRVFEGTQEQKYMVVSDRLGIFVPSLLAFQTRLYRFETGWSSPVASYGVIVGIGGSISTPDHNDLELGDIFQLEFRGYISTSYSAGKNLIYNQDAYKIYVQDTGKIRAAILTTGDAEVKYCTTTNIDSGFNAIRVTSDANTMKIYLLVGTEWVEKASVDLVSTVVPTITNTWYFNQNNVMPYIEYVKIWTD